MGTNDERLLSKKYFKKSEEYYQAGFETCNMSIRYKFWNIAKIYLTIAKNFEKLEEKGANTNV